MLFYCTIEGVCVQVSTNAGESYFQRKAEWSKIFKIGLYQICKISSNNYCILLDIIEYFFSIIVIHVLQYTV